ncbi:unnamed protein product [Bursaphelenchus okinawaensis]|uniref:DUF7808 domain-containing protein n=1 Tax=Bursaphelenchus okinawaensis TaxID=465554 RepID=A0A811KTE7_9BILA|nr:unnamed protein product [Bursaphelenchus okinawaensis]CAG9112323.1 unnamed protein product [Bursaphelenchus okinawaensis]
MLLRVVVVACLLVAAIAQWPRWEERTIDCTNSAKTKQCTLLAPNSKVPRDPAKYKCRQEPMPQNDWNTLAKNSTTRIACPIGCEPDADLSVIQKKPYVNKNCQKYYTYGKYRDTKENEWYLWITEPCVATLTTHCRFKDIPIHPEAEIPPADPNFQKRT